MEQLRRQQLPPQDPEWWDKMTAEKVTESVRKGISGVHSDALQKVSGSTRPRLPPSVEDSPDEEDTQGSSHGQPPASPDAGTSSSVSSRSSRAPSSTTSDTTQTRSSRTRYSLRNLFRR